MKYFAAYNLFLKRFAERGTPLSRMGMVHVILWPYLLAIIAVWSAFKALGRPGIVAYLTTIFISIGLLVVLSYTAFKFVGYVIKADSADGANRSKAVEEN